MIKSNIITKHINKQTYLERRHARVILVTIVGNNNHVTADHRPVIEIIINIEDRGDLNRKTFYVVELLRRRFETRGAIA